MTVSGTLPDKRWFEYSWAKHFNPDLDYTDWQPWDEWDYSSADRDRFTRIIFNNLDLIKHKKVFDIGCLLGSLAMIMSHNSAKQIVAVDIRKENIAVAQEVCKLAGYTNIEFYVCDLYDWPNMSRLIADCETILFSGVFYHINNHYQIIEQLTSTTAKNIILETVINNSQDATIKWGFEPSDDHRSGLNNGQSMTMIGFPSVKFCQNLLRHHGWKILSTDQYHYIPDSSDQAHDRCVISATRDIT